MSLLNIFKKEKEGVRFQKKQKERAEAKKSPDLVQDKKDEVKKGKILIAPHVTEKATLLGGKGVYVFKISPRANKIMVRRAIKETYGVIPQKINIVYAPSKRRFVKGKYGTRTGFKKAIIYLKEEDKIETS
ncbi:MAG: 50S ribosomal protein L23 [Patescibacteria group bacterium]